MKLTKDEFKKLQTEWYEKLYESGFIDLEKEEPVDPSKIGFTVNVWGKRPMIDESSTMKRIRINRRKKESDEEYYRAISLAAMDEETTYRSEVDKHILIRHSEGALIKTIVEELEKLGTPRRRNTIRFVIRRYEVLWGLKKYDLNQLNKYEASDDE